MEPNTSIPQKTSEEGAPAVRIAPGDPLDGAFFRLGVLVEGGLILLGAAVGACFTPTVFTFLQFNWVDAIAGLAATLPLLALFVLFWHRPMGSLRRLRDVLTAYLVPLIERTPHWQLAMVALLAGVGEELVFRGVVQAPLGRWLGPWPGLLIASAVFGLLHCLTFTYLVVATGIGVYLGLIFMTSGNLLPVIVAHALYDYLAIEYIRRYYRRARKTSSTCS